MWIYSIMFTRKPLLHTPGVCSVYTTHNQQLVSFVAHLVGWSLLLIYIVATAAVAAG